MTTTATILIGHAHQNHGGINPTFLIRFIENNKPALILQRLEGSDEPLVIVPTLENTIDDIYLMVAVLILKKVIPSKEIFNLNRNSLYDIFDENERFTLYEETKLALQNMKIKLIFNIFENSHLLNQIRTIKDYPCDFEVTLPVSKREYNAWSNKTINKGL